MPSSRKEQGGCAQSSCLNKNAGSHEAERRAEGHHIGQCERDIAGERRRRLFGEQKDGDTLDKSGAPSAWTAKNPTLAVRTTHYFCASSIKVHSGTFALGHWPKLYQGGLPKREGVYASQSYLLNSTRLFSRHQFCIHRLARQRSRTSNSRQLSHSQHGRQIY